ncbi:unnamed protein product, partial [Ectocarpus sp. 13 AM-2016]
DVQGVACNPAGALETLHRHEHPPEANALLLRSRFTILLFALKAVTKMQWFLATGSGGAKARPRKVIRA